MVMMFALICPISAFCQTQHNIQDRFQIVKGDTITDVDNVQEVNINNPDELKVNSQLNPIAGQQTDTLEYYSKTLEAHNYQDEILNSLLAVDDLKPFTVRKGGFFTRNSAHSASDTFYISILESSTVGLDCPGTSGFMKGAKQSSVYSAAIGYAKSKAVSETNPFIHDITLFYPDLA